GVAGSRLYAVIALTAAAMGLRNATMRRLAIPDLTPTMMTLTLTGLAADSSLAGGANPGIGRRVTSVLLLIAGAAIGALLLRMGTALPLGLDGARRAPRRNHLLRRPAVNAARLMR